MESLHRAIIKGHNINLGDYDDRRPLHLAALGGYKDAVEFLLSQGADINCKDRWGSTPLNDATDPTVIECLKEHGGERGNEHDFNEVPILPIGDE